MVFYEIIKSDNIYMKSLEIGFQFYKKDLLIQLE